jgi:hypothetical protein
MSLVEARRLMVEVVFNSWQKGTKFVGASCILFLTCLEVIMTWSCFVLVAMGSDINSLRECAFAIQIVLTSFVMTILMLAKSLQTSRRAVHNELANEIVEEFAQYSSCCVHAL